MYDVDKFITSRTVESINRVDSNVSCAKWDKESFCEFN